MRRLIAIGLVLTLQVLGGENVLADTFIVAGHPQNFAKSLSKQDLRRIFSGQRSWKDGRRVILVLPPKASPEMKWLCKEIMKMPERVYRRHLLSRVFRGQLTRPIQARDSKHAAELIGQKRGSLGPILKSAKPAALRTLGGR
jgi:hypothetical protein